MLSLSLLLLSLLPDFFFNSLTQFEYRIHPLSVFTVICTRAEQLSYPPSPRRVPLHTFFPSGFWVVAAGQKHDNATAGDGSA